MTTAEFKTMLTLYTPVSSLDEEEEVDRRSGKMSRSEFSSVIVEAGVLTDQEKVIILMESVVPSASSKATNRDLRTAITEDSTALTTTTKQPKEVEVVSCR